MNMRNRLEGKLDENLSSGKLRRCSKCTRILELNRLNFHKGSKRNGGFCYSCKDCFNSLYYQKKASR